MGGGLKREQCFSLGATEISIEPATPHTSARRNMRVAALRVGRRLEFLEVQGGKLLLRASYSVKSVQRGHA